jgi:hypothetical protein
MEIGPIIIKSSVVKTEVNTTNVKKKKKTKKSRCALDGCRKKLELIAWACKCDKKFCQNHRPAQSHSCSYNWRTSHQMVLNNTMLKGKSIDTKNFVNI